VRHREMLMAAAALATEALTTEPLTPEPLTTAHRSTHWALLTEAVVAVLVWLGAGARAPLRGVISRCKSELRNERRRRMVRVSCLEGVRRQPTGGGLSAEAMARNAFVECKKAKRGNAVALETPFPLLWFRVFLPCKLEDLVRNCQWQRPTGPSQVPGKRLERVGSLKQRVEPTPPCSTRSSSIHKRDRGYKQRAPSSWKHEKRFSSGGRRRRIERRTSASNGIARTRSLTTSTTVTPLADACTLLESTARRSHGSAMPSLQPSQLE